MHRNIGVANAGQHVGDWISHCHRRATSLPAGLLDARQFAGMRHFAETYSAETELAVYRVRSAASATTRIPTHLEFRCALLLFSECFFSHGSLPLASEREIKGREQCTPVVVGFRRGDDRDVHSPSGVDTVVVDLGEHELFGHAERVIAVAVE